MIDFLKSDIKFLIFLLNCSIISLKFHRKQVLFQKARFSKIYQNPQGISPLFSNSYSKPRSKHIGRVQLAPIPASFVRIYSPCSPLQVSPNIPGKHTVVARASISTANHPIEPKKGNNCIFFFCSPPANVPVRAFPPCGDARTTLSESQ